MVVVKSFIDMFGSIVLGIVVVLAVIVIIAAVTRGNF